MQARVGRLLSIFDQMIRAAYEQASGDDQATMTQLNKANAGFYKDLMSVYGSGDIRPLRINPGRLPKSVARSIRVSKRYLEEMRKAFGHGREDTVDQAVRRCAEHLDAVACVLKPATRAAKSSRRAPSTDAKSPTP